MDRLQGLPLIGLTPEIRRLIDALPVGLVVLDRHGSELLMNTAAHEIWGLPLGEPVLGPRARGWWTESGAAVAGEEWPHVRALTSGEVTTGNRIDIQRLDGPRATILVSAAPLKSLKGDIVGAVAAFQDVTEQRRRQCLQESHARIETLIGSNIRAEEVLREVLQEVTGSMGANSAVLYRGHENQWVVQAAYGDLTEPISEELTNAEMKYSKESASRHDVLGVPNVIYDPTFDQALAARYGIASFIDSAVLLGDKLVGNLVVHFREPRTAFTESERSYLSDVAFAIGQALAVSTEYQGQEQVASALQAALLELPPDIPGLHVARAYHSASEIAHVGGDYYDVFPVPSGHVCVAIGDVSGKGLDAARVMGLVKYSVRAYAYDGNESAVILAKTNTLLYGLTSTETFATAFVGLFDPGSRTLTYCNAGHPAGLVRRANSEVDYLRSRSPLVGALAESVFVQDATRLGEGEYLLLYTDGAIEARSEGRMFGEERVVDQVLKSESVDDACRRLLRAVDDFTGGRHADDMAVLGVTLL